MHSLTPLRIQNSISHTAAIVGRTTLTWRIFIVRTFRRATFLLFIATLCNASEAQICNPGRNAVGSEVYSLSAYAGTNVNYAQVAQDPGITILSMQIGQPYVFVVKQAPYYVVTSYPGSTSTSYTRCYADTTANSRDANTGLQYYASPNGQLVETGSLPNGQQVPYTPHIYLLQLNTPLSVGSHTIIATSGGYKTGQVTAQMPVTVTKADTSILVNPTSQNAGRATFDVRVNGFKPTNVVNVTINGVTNNPISLTPVNDGQSAATASFNLAAASYVLVFSYAGDGNNNTSSTTVNQTIPQTTPGVSASVSRTSAVLNTYLVSAAVTGYSPSGTVTIYEDGRSLAVLSQPSILGNTSTFARVLSLSVGTHSITAAYSGDSNNVATSSSAMISVVPFPSAFVVPLNALFDD